MNRIDRSIYSNFTPLPEDLRGWNGEQQIFPYLVEQVRPRHIIEVGTWKGLSAISMAKRVKELCLDCTLTCVDTWLGALEFWDDLKESAEHNLQLKNGYPQVYYQFLSNVVHAGLQDIILPFPTTSAIAAHYFKKNKIGAQLIYIDGSHQYEDVRHDINAYFEILDPGGIIFGDDFTPGWPGVDKAVREFSEQRELSLLTSLPTFWLIRKPEP